MQKLSAIWDRAAKELKQGKGKCYDKTDDTHCALGAIIHYIDGHDRCVNDFELSVATHLVTKAISLDWLVVRNDKDNWTFAQFAQYAKERDM